MDGSLIAALVGVVALIAGAAVSYVVLRASARGVVATAERTATQIAEEASARRRAEDLEAQEQALTDRREAEEEVRERRREAQRAEQRLEQREENIERRAETIEASEQSLRDRRAEVDGAEQEAREVRERAGAELERVAALTAEEAREQLLARLDDELREEAARRVRAMETSAKAEADTRARKVLATVMQRMTSEITAETTATVVPLPSDEIKGRIIGREGRNIRAFEAATGCDLIVDDTPEAVTITSFDPVRREVARVALSRLIQDGRIQPTRIESVVDKARQEVDRMVIEAGDHAVADAEVTGLHPEVVKTLGRLRFRYSYGQNQLRHCIETSWLAAAVAHEIGADVELCRVGGLLHDLGKAVDREVEGTHAAVGAEIARRFQVPRDVVHCIAAHHEEVPPETTEALVVIIADAMSGSRPGARRESAEQYIKRLDALESIANSFEGVEQSFAIQAGREVRVLVHPERIDDLEAARLATEVSRQIEETLQYPGEIKVTVVRETRSSAVAR